MFEKGWACERVLHNKHQALPAMDMNRNTTCASMDELFRGSSSADRAQRTCRFSLGLSLAANLTVPKVLGSIPSSPTLLFSFFFFMASWRSAELDGRRQGTDGRRRGVDEVDGTRKC